VELKVEEDEAEGKEEIGRRQKWRREKRNERQEGEELVVREDPVIAAEKTKIFFLYFGLSNK
jgi:hypothetical protein